MCVLHSMAVFLSKNEKLIYGVNLSNPEISHLHIPLSHKSNNYEPLEIICPSNSGQYVQVIEYSPSKSKKKIRTFFNFDGTNTLKKVLTDSIVENTR